MSDKSIGKRRIRSPSRDRYRRGTRSTNSSNRPRSRSRPPTHHQRPHSRHSDSPPQRQSPTRRLDPVLTYQHPFGYRHESGCRLCDEFSDHLREEARGRPEFARSIVEASLADPPEVIRRRYEEQRDRAERLEGEIDDLRARFDSERDRATRLSREMQTRDQESVRSQNEISSLRRELAQLRTLSTLEGSLPRAGTNAAQDPQIPQLLNSLEQSTRELARLNQRSQDDERRLHNAQGRYEELLNFLLSQGHTVTATSGNSSTQTLPRPYLTISPAINGTVGRYIVPNARDEDVQMEGAESAAALGYEGVAYVPDEDGGIRRLARDIYEELDNESDEDVPPTDSEDDGFDGDDGGSPRGRKITKAKKGKKKGKKSATIAHQTTSTSATHTAGSSRLAVRTPSPIRATTSRSWSDQVEADSPWSRVPTSGRTSEGWGWGNNPQTFAQAVQSPPTSSTAPSRRIAPPPSRPPPSAPRSFFRGGGFGSGINHGTFNGLPWVSRRLAPVYVPPGTSSAERNEILTRARRNRARGPLQQGQIPPAFQESHVLNEEILRNLIERTSSAENPGSRDAIEIVGDLLNASSRVPRDERHPLEEFVVKNYSGRPKWAKDESKFKHWTKEDKSKKCYAVEPM
ncbi:hypothetical protein QCA50_014712 [Cerrena zonata]|uniref:Uncharacterized protein n=1 Tax=Cerrena zonata TaxID=2478898 RepID=A0AAW0FXM8_9APHY